MRSRFGVLMAWALEPTKILTLQDCLRALKKQLGPPALSVDVSDGGSGKLQMVAQQQQFPGLLVLYEDHDAAQKDVLPGFAMGRQDDNLIGYESDGGWFS